MQLKFPKRRNFWSWSELSCLSRVLGFQKDLFKRNVPKEKEANFKDGLHLKDIDELIDTKALAGDLHRTFNMHDAAYNTKVIQKSMEFLSNRLLTFQHIKDARMAYQLYEHMDNAGLVINEHIMSRTLKLCGRAISQIKLMQHIKHMDRLVQDRLMFYEFLEILLICEKVPEMNTSSTQIEPQMDVRDERDLYQLQDFRNILLTEDEKISEELNEAYKKSQERTPLKKSNKGGEIKEEKPWHIAPTVDHKFREQMVAVNIRQKKILTEQLQISNQEVMVEGTFQSCNCDKPDLLPKEESTGKNENQKQIIDTLQDLSKQHAANLATNDISNLVYRREHLVTETELAETRNQVDDLQWNIATQGERMKKRREATGGRQKRYQHSQNDASGDKVKAAQEIATAREENLLKGNMSFDSSKEFRKRLKEMSLREAGIQSSSKTYADERPKAEVGKKSVLDNISLDERLKQIDTLMDRVCQR